MGPKRKASIPPKDAKVAKKGIQMRQEESTFQKQDYNISEKNIKGKNKIYDREDNNHCQPVKIENLSPELLDENHNTNKAECQNLELNRLLQTKLKHSLMGSISCKTFLFPSVQDQDSTVNNSQKYFGFDLVKDNTERTIWTHKASVWTDLFSSVQELAKTSQAETISEMFNGIFTCAVRADPKGSNEIQTFRSNKGQNIQHWIMLVPMPADIDYSEYIHLFIGSFQHLCKKQFIRSAYKSGVQGFTSHHGLLSQVSEDGSYWHAIDNAFQKDVIFKYNTCLKEVLLDSVIKDVVSLMFGVKKDPNTWTDSVKTFAFGN